MRTLNRKSEQAHRPAADPLITKRKFDELTKKLARLRASQPHAAEEVRRLAEMGDFSENFAYQITKGRLRGINQAILHLERELDEAEIISTDAGADTVHVGHTVTLENAAGQKTYQILGSSESSPAKGVISYQSPLGTALLDRKVGEKITISLGAKETEYTIIKIA